MKVFYTILLFLFLSVGFAQTSKLKGTWIEYKREIVGDTNSITNLEYIHAYTFYEDTTYIVPGKIREFDFLFSNDTITLCPGCFCDCNIPIEEYTYKFTGTNKAQNNILILSDINRKDEILYNHYFKKTRKLPKICKK